MNICLKIILIVVRLLEYEQPGSVTPAKHCQVRKHLSYRRRGITLKINPVIRRSSYIICISQLRDLCDLLHVYVAPSQASDVAGEGLYVRRKVSRYFLGR